MFWQWPRPWSCDWQLHTLLLPKITKWNLRCVSLLLECWQAGTDEQNLLADLGRAKSFFQVTAQYSWQSFATSANSKIDRLWAAVQLSLSQPVCQFARAWQQSEPRQGNFYLSPVLTIKSPLFYLADFPSCSSISSDWAETTTTFEKRIYQRIWCTIELWSLSPDCKGMKPDGGRKDRAILVM